MFWNIMTVCFRPDDLFLVRMAKPEVDEIEIAEKSVFWLKIVVNGKQCHAAFPCDGSNSLVATSAFIMKLRGLYKHFSDNDPLFLPPISTFEPTKKESNVENINTLPGRIFFISIAACCLNTGLTM